VPKGLKWAAARIALQNHLYMYRTESLFGRRGAQGRAPFIWRFLGFFALVLLADAFAAAQAAERLFASPSSPLRAQNAPAPGYLRTRRVQINTAMLAPSSPVRRAAFRAAADQPSFVLNLFADKEIEVLVERTVSKGTATFTSFGKVVGQPESQVILALADGVMAGSVFVPGENTVQISYAGNGYHMVGELDPEQIPPCNTVVPNEHLQPVQGGENPAMAGDAQPHVDIMVVYTAAARNGAGGTAAMQALIDLAIAEANQAYENSDITNVLNLVYRGEVTYTESGSAATDLNRMQAVGDGQLDAVHTLRAQYGADVVVLITESMATYAGLGFIMAPPSSAFDDYAFAVVKRQYASGSYVFAHEVGHVMGCQHDRDNATSSGAYDYSYGHRFSDGTNTLRTIMAYAPGNRIPYFSNPDVTYSSVATGIAAGATNSANNALTISNTRSVVAGFADPATSIDFEITSTNVTEAGVTLTFNVLRQGAVLTNTATVQYSSTGVSATAGGDYTATSGTLTFSSGETNKTLSLTILNDSNVESSEVVRLSLSNPTNAVLGVDRTIDVTIDDDDTGFSFTASTMTVAEDGTNVVVNVRRTGDASATNEVDYATSDSTATAGSDYTSTTGTLTFAPGETNKTLTVTIASDAAYEANETFRISLTNATSGAGLASPSNIVVTILEDDSTISLSTNAVSANENSASITLTLTRSGGTNGTSTVDFYTSDGTATNAVDYTGTNATVSFGPGIRTRTISVPLLNDTEVEGDETFSVTLTNIVGADLGTYTNATITIRDNDSTFNLSTNAVSVNESAGSVTLTVVRTGGTIGSASVQYATATNGSASATTDFTSKTGTLTFASGETNKTISVTLKSDTTYETNETFNVGLSTPSADASLGGTTNATVTITDTTSYLTFETNAVSVSEGAGTATVTVNRSGALSQTNRLTYTFTAGAAGASDYSATNGTLTFAPNATNATITVGITDDSLVETNESFRVTISAATGGAIISGTNVASITITENDVGLAFSPASYSISEAGTNVTLTVVQTGDLSATNSVEYLTADVSASAGADYTNSSGTLNFGPGTNSLTITVPIIDDSSIEGNETFRVSLTNAAGATLLANSNAVVTILENEAVLSLSTNAITVNENAGSATLTVLRTGGTNYTATVEYATADGSATNSVDYTNTSGTLSFGPGVTSRTISVPLINDSTVDGNNDFTLTLSNPVSAAIGANTNATVTIRDNDSTFDFSTNAASVAETAGSVTLNIRRAGGVIGAATVRYATTTNGTATAGSDFTSRSGVLSFAANETNKTVTIPVANDSANESAETLICVLSNPTGEGALGTNDTVTVTINDNDSLLAWDTNAISVAENAGTVTLTVNRTGTLTGTNTINYAFTAGTAGTSDYAGTNGTLTFAPNATNATITVAITEDSIIESNETFRVTLSNPSAGGLISGTNAAVVTITEDDAGLAFSAASYSIAEAGTNVTLTVVQTGNLDLTNTVDYVMSDISATDGTDYTNSSGTLNFGPGTNSLTIVVPVVNDSTVETNETFRVSLTNVVNAVLLAQSNAVVTILENDVVLELSTNAVTVNENGASATVTVLRTGGTNTTVTVDYATADGSATNAVDYTNTSGTLSFGPGVISRTITVPIINDADVDGDNDFSVTLSNPSAATLGSATNATVTILDNDSTIQFSTNAVTVAETAGAVTLTLLRSGGTIGAATVRYATTNDSAVAGSDFTTRSGLVSFRAGETNKTISVTLINDAVYETNQTFNVVLSSPTGEATLGTNDAAAVTITDNDSSVSWDTNAVSVAENAGTVTLTVNRTGTLSLTNTVAYTITVGSAGTSDYTGTNGVMTFAPNATNGTITVAITEDSVVETNEIFYVVLSNPTGGALISGTNKAAVTITEDDAGLAFASATYSISEAGTNVTLTVLQTGNLNATNSVDYVMTDITAAAGADYTNSTGTLTFGPGTNSLTITVPITDDSTLESNETFRVSLTNVVNAVLLATSNSVVTILEDDSAFSFSTNAVTVAESATSATLTVLRTGGTNLTITVDYATADGTATNAVDYTNTSGTLSFGPGVASRTVTVPIINDTDIDGTNNFSVTLSNPSGASLGSTTNATVTILDNDSTIQFSTNAVSVAETGSTVTLTLTRTGGTVAGATVHYGTTNVSASAGFDYLTKSGVINFAAGETNKTFTISIKNDTTVETNETFQVVLSSPTGSASLGTNDTSTVTITDNDSTLSFQTNAVTVAEGTATATITIKREGTLTLTNTVAFTFSNGTAGTSDYTGTNGTLTFLPNATNATITVGITNDSLVETNEVFYLTLSNPAGGALISGTNKAAITITENDAGIAFSAASFSAAETGTNVVLTIVQTGNTNATVSVDYVMTDITATDGADYTNSTGTLDFGPGTNSLTITVPVINDSAIENNETFRVSLTNISSGILLTHSNAVVSILEDDSLLAFTTNAVSVLETASAVTLTVLRTGGTNFDATVDFAITTNSTATAAADYTSTNGTLTFSAGVRSRTITVPLSNDSSVEGDETVVLELSNVTDAVLGTYTNATVTIRDNDSVFSLSTNAVTVSEGAGTTVINVRRTGGVVAAATVRYATANGTATAGSDYRAKSGSLNFVAGETNKTITLSILNDLVVDTNETFTLTLSSPTAEAALGTNVTTYTIADNDFSIGDVVNETPSAPLVITGFGLEETGAVLLEVEGPLGSAVIIEATTDLSTWNEVAGGLLSGSPLQLRDGTAEGEPRRFYRVRQPHEFIAVEGE
jgi:hypothetical protein